jgi:hypothetical protein
MVEHVHSPTVDSVSVVTSLIILDDVVRALGESYTREEERIEPQVGITDWARSPQVCSNLRGYVT